MIPLTTGLEDSISTIMNNFLIGLLLAALAIFGWLAIISKNIRTFQFQLSLFIIIWIAGEIVGVVLGEGVSILPGFRNIAMQIHLGAMIFFCAMIWLRYYSSKAKGKKMVEDPSKYYVD